MSDQPRLLIAGCGDLGQRLAPRMSGWDVHGLRRDPSGLAAGIRPVAADLTDPSTLDVVAGNWDAVVYTATPGAFTPDDYRAAYVTGQRRLAERVSASRWVLVSSTAVYGQQAGEWVDENSPTEPTRFNGEILLEAEALAHDLGGVALRFSGIYGPGRDFLIRKLRAGGVTCRRDPPVWTNRIHAEDCAGALAHVLGLDAPDPILIGSDEEPAPRWDVLQWLATRLGVPGPEEAEVGEDRGKRISSARLRATGYSFDYPDFRSGYKELIE
jgi:nucleoside-diphosphate-sugar epimerase